MFEAVWSPGLGLEPFFLDGAAVDHAFTKRAVIDSPQSVLDLLQKNRLGIGSRELFALQFVADRGIARIPDLRFPLTRAFFGSLYSREQAALLRK
jgi:hypothetical protein